jgi:hypothetical protein
MVEMMGGERWREGRHELLEDRDNLSNKWERRPASVMGCDWWMLECWSGIANWPSRASVVGVDLADQFLLAPLSLNSVLELSSNTSIIYPRSLPLFPLCGRAGVHMLRALYFCSKTEKDWYV